MGHIFISYRREDSAYVAGMLCERLKEAFGAGSVFIDVDTIPFGVDFRDHINGAVARSDVLLVIIGDSWLRATGETSRRIDNATDFVRLEIEAALTQQIPIVPVLVERATMPREEELPASIRAVAFRNAAELRSGRDMSHHMQTLVRGLQTYVKAGDPKAGHQRPRGDTENTVPQEIPETQVELTRLSRWTLALSRVGVKINGREIGSLSNGESLRVGVKPGDTILELTLRKKTSEHTLQIADRETRTIVLEIDGSGQISIVRGMNPV